MYFAFRAKSFLYHIQKTRLILRIQVYASTNIFTVEKLVDGSSRHNPTSHLQINSQCTYFYYSLKMFQKTIIIFFNKYMYPCTYFSIKANNYSYYKNEYIIYKFYIVYTLNYYINFIIYVQILRRKFITVVFCLIIIL